MSTISNSPAALDAEPEFSPFTDGELAAMDAPTRRKAFASAKTWWKAEMKRRRKADKRAREAAREQ